MATASLLSDGFRALQKASDELATDALFLSFLVGIAEGIVSAALVLSIALVEPPELYATAAGAFHASFAAVSLGSLSLLRTLGMPWCLRLGAMGAALFVLALATPTLPVLLPAAVVGGAGVVLMRTAKDPYLVEGAARYALVNRELLGAAQEEEIELLIAGDGSASWAESKSVCKMPRRQEENEARTVFHGAFASAQLISHVVCKGSAFLILSSATGLEAWRLPGQTGSVSGCAVGMYLLFALLCAASALVLGAHLRSVPVPFQEVDVRYGSTLTAITVSFIATVSKAVRAVFSRKALSMALTNVTFGLMDAFFPTIVTSAVADAHGSAAAALLYLLSNVTAALAAVPLASASGPRGRAAVVCLGGAAFLAPSLAVLLLEESRYTQWDVLAVLFVLYGVGVSVWQGAVMALWAELFAGELEVAFAPLKVQSGGASAVAFFTFRYLTDGQIAALCAACGGASILCFLVQRRWLG